MEERHFSPMGSVLGKNKNNRTVIQNATRQGAPRTITVRTGILDYLGDEIVLTVFPDSHYVSDEGYTNYLCDMEYVQLRFSKARIFMESLGLTLVDGHYQELRLSYEGDNWEEATKKMVGCILDIYTVLTLRMKPKRKPPRR